MFYYAVRVYFDVVFIFEFEYSLSMFPRVPGRLFSLFSPFLGF